MKYLYLLFLLPLLFVPLIEGSTLPSNTFRTFFVGSDNVTATTTYDSLELIEGAGMTITPDYGNKTITFASGGQTLVGSAKLTANQSTGLVVSIPDGYDTYTIQGCIIRQAGQARAIQFDGVTASNYAFDNGVTSGSGQTSLHLAPNPVTGTPATFFKITVFKHPTITGGWAIQGQTTHVYADESTIPTVRTFSGTFDRAASPDLNSITIAGSATQLLTGTYVEIYA